MTANITDARLEWIAMDAVSMALAIERGDKTLARGYARLIRQRATEVIDALTEPTVCHEAPKLSTSAEIEDDGFTTVLGVK